VWVEGALGGGGGGGNEWVDWFLTSDVRGI
jgi:hypothetical protein